MSIINIFVSIFSFHKPLIKINTIKKDMNSKDKFELYVFFYYPYFKAIFEILIFFNSRFTVIPLDDGPAAQMVVQIPSLPPALKTETGDSGNGSGSGGCLCCDCFGCDWCCCCVPV